MECLENVYGRVARFPARVPGRESTVSPSMTTSEDLRRAFPLEAVLALVALSLLGCFAHLKADENPLYATRCIPARSEVCFECIAHARLICNSQIPCNIREIVEKKSNRETRSSKTSMQGG